MKKIIIVLFLLIILSSCSIEGDGEKDKKIMKLENRIKNLQLEYNNKKVDNSLILERDGNIIEINNYASCKLKLNTTVSENTSKENTLKVSHSIQEKSLNIAFSDLNKDFPYMESNGGKTKLTKIDNGNFLYLFEKTGAGNIVIYTLFKEKGILIMSKQYDIFGYSFGTQMIGFCN